MTEINKLERLCGLTPNVLAEVLENNPRAYMAVKGAVAEKHLENYFRQLVENGEILEYRVAEGDFDKDFYVTLLTGVELIVECKNVQVLNLGNKNLILDYLLFAQSRGQLANIRLKEVHQYSSSELRALFGSLPQNYRESGIPRYEFSESLVDQASISGEINSEEFLSQFNPFPISIDFQRTRNSRDRDARAGRFYRTDEIHIVGACLFSRTMNWEFLFGNFNSFPIHPRHPDRFSNRLILEPGSWQFNFLEVIP